MKLRLFLLTMVVMLLPINHGLYAMDEVDPNPLTEENHKSFFGHSKKEKEPVNPQVGLSDQFQSPNTATNQEQYLKLEKIIATNEELSFWGVAIFKGNDIFGKGILLGTASNWSHTGVILKGKSPDAEKAYYCFESTGDAKKILKKRILPQVQLTPWEEVVKTYNGDVARRKFKFANKAPDSEIVKKYVLENLGKPYEKDLSKLIKVIKGDNKMEDNTSVFCSELVAEMLLSLDIRNDANISENFLPRHFGDPIAQPLCEGSCGGKLGDIEVIKRL